MENNKGLTFGKSVTKGTALFAFAIASCSSMVSLVVGALLVAIHQPNMNAPELLLALVFGILQIPGIAAVSGMEEVFGQGVFSGYKGFVLAYFISFVVVFGLSFWIISRKKKNRLDKNA
jgi:hypothetical protein